MRAARIIIALVLFAEALFSLLIIGDVLGSLLFCGVASLVWPKGKRGTS